MWSGFVFQPVLDLNGDGFVNELDVAEECGDSLALLECTYDLDKDGVIDLWDGTWDDADEFENWLNHNMEGYVFPLGLDINGDGVVNEADVPSEYDNDDPPDGIQFDELLIWVEETTGTDPNNYLVDLWEYYSDEDPIWIFSIADLVYQNQVFINEGIKNLQIRFYPVAITDFSPTPVDE